MKALSRCKICNYVMETDKIPDLCPACGLPKKVFEPYVLPISESRHKVLSLHLHPIILHFPQAFVVTALGLLVISLLLTGSLQDKVYFVAQFNLVFLPLTVLLGALTGMKDGQLRFKKVTTPILVQKIVLSVAFLVLSIVDAVLAVVLSFNSVTVILLIAFTLIATVIAIILGRIGGHLMDCYIPGKEKEKKPKTKIVQ